MTRSIDLFYFVGSLYSYFAVMRAEPAARAAGLELRWRPFNVRAIMLEQDNLPRKKPVKMQYTWRDIERRARRLGLDFKPGVPLPVDADYLGNRVATVAAEEGSCADFSQRVFRAWFAEHKDPGEPGHLRAVLLSMGRDPEAVLARADSAEIRQRYDAQTDAARKLGIFGAPTFVVGGEIFWGFDRLDDAIDWARKT